MTAPLWSSSAWASTATVVIDAGGGGKKRKRKGKYPRRVMVDGVLHWVRNAEEERQLLRAILERAQDATKVATALGDEKLAIRIQSRAVRFIKRLDAVDSREDEWLKRLLAEDEELLLMVN